MPFVLHLVAAAGLAVAVLGATAPAHAAGVVDDNNLSVHSMKVLRKWAGSRTYQQADEIVYAFSADPGLLAASYSAGAQTAPYGYDSFKRHVTDGDTEWNLRLMQTSLEVGLVGPPAG
jgi:hypothetical protein